MKYDLKTLFRARIIDDLDFHFASFMERIEKNEFSNNETGIFLTGAALISRQIYHGHICLTDSGIEALRDEFENERNLIPQWSEIVSVLSKSSSCSDGKSFSPIVFYGNRFYLYRYWQYEFSLAKSVKEMSETGSGYSEKHDEIEKNIETLFAADGKENGQLEAALMAVSNRFSVITGGPGTGKTTAIAKILAAIFKCCPDETVLLAAPTGKAASRMNEALKNAVAFAGDLIDGDVAEKILSLSGSSIHRLLGWTRNPGVFVHNRENPLEAGIVIVDEASMIDLSMMSKLVDAVKKESSLVLIGDKDQLTSVEAGNVLGDICEAFNEGAFEKRTVSVLKKSYRFGKSIFIGELADALNRGADIETLKTIFDGCDDGSVNLVNCNVSRAMEVVEEAVVKNYSFLFKDNDVSKILEELEKFRILCASKLGNGGVGSINRFCEKIFAKAGIIRSAEIWYHGRPVMVTENNYVLELFNGDCGVILEKDGEKRGYFSANDGSVRSVPVSMLPNVETVYAMTVHKSQGSEYDEVMIILPEKEMSVLTKELVYTAVTRAKKKLSIIADEFILECSVKKSAARNSGLADALIFLSKQ